MFYDILDEKRIKILPLLKNFKEEFYLAGGTSLALQIGHRDSVDFDFFKQDDIEVSKLFEKIKNIFHGYKILKIQEEKNTLTVLVDENIKLSFFSYKYKLIKETRKEECLSLASVKDIACMKLSAILSRATNKDYIDLYYIFKKYDFEEILNLCEKKFDDIDVNLILKSLVYFDDVELEPIVFKHGNQVKFDEVKKFLIKLIKSIKTNTE
ncbi:nucleotidyl transferase AbiEii/AbiGii toxin family protein [bacterium]|nr:nucleotidyl transferase AbiEii/AbiGii toxin family protein [bacterium]